MHKVIHFSLYSVFRYLLTLFYTQQVVLLPLMCVLKAIVD